MAWPAVACVLARSQEGAHLVCWLAAARPSICPWRCAPCCQQSSTIFYVAGCARMFAAAPLTAGSLPDNSAGDLFGIVIPDPLCKRLRDLQLRNQNATLNHLVDKSWWIFTINIIYCNSRTPSSEVKPMIFYIHKTSSPDKGWLRPYFLGGLHWGGVCPLDICVTNFRAGALRTSSR